MDSALLLVLLLVSVSMWVCVCVRPPRHGVGGDDGGRRGPPATQHQRPPSHHLRSQDTARHGRTGQEREASIHACMYVCVFICMYVVCILELSRGMK